MLITPSVVDYILAGLGKLVDNLAIISRWVNGAQGWSFMLGFKTVGWLRLPVVVAMITA